MWFVFQIMSVSFWAMINILDSMLVRRYSKNPFFLMWSQSCFSIPLLLVIVLSIRTPIDWLPLFFIAGAIGYAGDLLFFFVLDRVDVSVANVAWILLSIILAISGFVFFEESWNFTQSIGVFLVIGGIALLSIWHHHLTISSLLLLLCLAFLYTPFYSIQKAALLSGVDIVGVSFWPLIARETLAFTSPVFLPSLRLEIKTEFMKLSRMFHTVNAVVIALFISATFLTTVAFSLGKLSLVAIVGNIQPILVIALAWLVCRMVPVLAPRELLTSQSIQVKIVSFSVVFVGLWLLATG